jgi:hypothetical protein
MSTEHVRTPRPRRSSLPPVEAPDRLNPSLKAALHMMRDGAQLFADGLNMAGIVVDNLLSSGSLGVRPAAAPEELLTIEQVSARTDGTARSTLDRMTKGRPCRRKVGSKVFIEWNGFLALTRELARKA